MGDLYSVYATDQMPEEARSFFAQHYGVGFPETSNGRLPTLRELRSALDAMEDCKVTYFDSGRSWHADIQRHDAEGEWTTVVVTADTRPADDESPVDFYFEKGAMSLMVELLARLAPCVGTLLLHPHAGDELVLCATGGPPRTFAAREDLTEDPG